MRILIDIQGAQNSSRTRGIGRYTRDLARAVVKIATNHEVLLLVSDQFPDTIQGIANFFRGVITAEQIVVFKGVRCPGEAASGMIPAGMWRRSASEILMGKLIAELNIDAYLVCSLFEGASDGTIAAWHHPDRSYITSSILYDLIPLSDEERYLRSQPLKRWYFRRLRHLKKLDHLFAISSSARDEGYDHAQIAASKISVIGAAAGAEFSPVGKAGENKVVEKYQIYKPYIMHASAFEKRKNFEGLIKAYGLIPKHHRANYQLVLVCKIDDKERSALRKLISQAGLRNDEVVLTGFVPDAELPLMYRNAHLFVFPSFHEGFGLPALEAMCCGTPTIGSNNSSIPEVIGMEEALFDAESPQQIADVMMRAITDEAFYQRLRDNAGERARAFSWEKSAELALTALEDLQESRNENGGHRHDKMRPNASDFIDLIANIETDLPLTVDDLQEVAEAMAANESTAARAQVSYHTKQHRFDQNERPVMENHMVQ